MGLSRADLADLMEAKVVSITKYEKAGEEGGQYPPFPKLAKLSFILNMNPSSLFWAALDKDTYETFTRDDGPRGPVSSLHNDDAMRGQMSSYYLIAKTMRKKGKDDREAKKLLADRDFAETADSKFSNLKDKFRLIDLFREVVKEEIHQAINSNNAISMQNGPDQKDPDRPSTLKNNTEAVEAASTRPKKGRTDGEV